MQALDAAYVSGKFRHGGDPVLQWNAANLVPRRDANMNMAPDRKRSADKIDGMCALLMAVGRQMLAPAGNFDGFLADPDRARTSSFFASGAGSGLAVRSGYILGSR